MNNIAGPRILVAITTLLSLPAAVFLGTSVGKENIKPLLLMGGLVILAVLLLGIPQWLWIFAVGSIFVPGQLTALPLPFNPMEIFLILVLARYLVDDMILKKRWPQFGVSPDKFFVIGLLLIMLYHGFQDRFAMRILGSSTWGGRAYISLSLAFLTYFIVQSTALNHKAFHYLPTVVVLFGSIDFIINLIVTVLPETAVFFWRIYTNVRVDSDIATFAGRWGFAANFGYLLIFWSLSDCRIQDFLQNGRIFKASVCMIGVILCIASGYRSSIIIASIIIAVATYRDFGFSGILGVFPLVILFGSLAFLNSVGVQLPQRVQRGLTWLPGTWDQAAAADAEGSLDFRTEVWSEWRQNQFPKAPIFGRGIGLNYEDMLATLPFISEAGDPFALAFSRYTRNEAFVISGNLHHGLYSTIDRFGLIGAFCFVAWTYCVLRRIFIYLLSARREKMDPALQWLGLYIFAFSLAFPIGALRIETFLPQQLFLTGLFLGLLKIKQKSKAPLQESSNIPRAVSKMQLARSA